MHLTLQLIESEAAAFLETQTAQVNEVIVLHSRQRYIGG